MNVFELNVHHLGDFLLHASIVVCAFVVVASVVGQLRSDGRLLLAAERGGYVVSAFVGTGALLLLQGIAEVVRCVVALRDGAWPARLHDVEEVDVENLKKMVGVDVPVVPAQGSAR